MYCGHRFVENNMLLTYRTGQEALAATSESTSRNVGGEQLLVALQTPDWCSCVEREFSLIRSSTAETYAATSNSLLGEDFSIPSMSFDDMDGNHLSTPRGVICWWKCHITGI